MFNTVLQQITGFLDRRFLLNAFFPSLIFWALLMLVWFVGQQNLVAVITLWDQQNGILKVLEIIGFVSWTTLSAGVIASQWGTIVRFYEGYWSFPFYRRFWRFLEAQGKGWYRSKLKGFDQELDANPYASCYEEVSLYYPPRKRLEAVMPTRLGNILRNAEFYPALRYNINSIWIWPRLYNLFPPRFIAVIAEAKSALDFMLVVSALSFIFSLISSLYLLIMQSDWQLFILCLAGGVLISFGAYLGALRNAFIYAQVIKVGFDLYRNELIKQMCLSLPENPGDERCLWSDINQFFYRFGVEPENFIYVDYRSDNNSEGNNES